MELSGPLGFQDFCEPLLMVMNHLVIYYLEIILCNYASSKYEGEYDRPRGDQEHLSDIGTACSISGSEKLPSVLAAFSFSLKCKLPDGPPVECSLIRQLF